MDSESENKLGPHMKNKHKNRILFLKMAKAVGA